MSKRVKASEGDFVLFKSCGYWVPGVVAGVNIRGEVIKARTPVSGIGRDRWRLTDVAIAKPRFVCSQAKFDKPIDEIVRSAPLFADKDDAKHWFGKFRA